MKHVPEGTRDTYGHILNKQHPEKMFGYAFAAQNAQTYTVARRVCLSINTINHKLFKGFQCFVRNYKI